MVYKNKNEEYRSLEQLHERQEQGIPSDSHLTHEQIEKTFSYRRGMLSSIEAVIASSFYEAIAAKIDYENTFLLKIFEEDEQAREAKKRDVKILNSQYFTQKKLDPKQFLTL